MKGSRDCDVLVLDAMLNHVPVPLVTSNADYLVRKCQSVNHRHQLLNLTDLKSA